MSNDARCEKTRCCPSEEDSCRAGSAENHRGRPFGGLWSCFCRGNGAPFPAALQLLRSRCSGSLEFALPWGVGVVFNYFDEICHENTRRG